MGLGSGAWTTRQLPGPGLESLHAGLKVDGFGLSTPGLGFRAQDSGVGLVGWSRGLLGSRFGFTLYRSREHPPSGPCPVRGAGRRI